jgi:hypothetical protein
MSDLITLDIPHKLGRAGARQRLDDGIGQLAGTVPGGSLVEHHWEGDTLAFVLQAMGQRIRAELQVLDTTVHAVIDLPAFAALFANTVKSHLEAAGTKLLH